MKKTITKIFMEFFVFIFILLLLFFSNECVSLASNGLLIWFQKMIPSLFPFMILCGFMIRSGLSYKLGKWLQPFLGILFHLPSQMLYVIFMGFLCGFPMGSKLIADMLETKQITPKDGEFLLAFCNNIGPLYLLGYVFPLFHWKPSLKFFMLMYGVPLLYGLYLRYFSSYQPISPKTTYNADVSKIIDYPTFLYQSLMSAIEQITLLGGCMIFFNCLQIFPTLLKTYMPYLPGNFLYKIFTQGILCSFLEIGGGLSFFATHENIEILLSTPFFPTLIIILLTFGGLSCIFQTYLILQKTNLKITDYIKHKLIQSFLILAICFITL